MDLKLSFEGFEGTVTIRSANNLEKLRVLDKLGFDMQELTTKKAEDKFKKLSTITMLIEMSKDYYKKVSLKREGKDYKSFNDLLECPQCNSVLMECATKSLLGLGEDEKK